MSHQFKDQSQVSNPKPLWFLSDWSGCLDWNDWKSSFSDQANKAENLSKSIESRKGSYRNPVNENWKSILAEKTSRNQQYDNVKD